MNVESLTCLEVEQLLPALIRNDLEVSLKSGALAHLGACGPCGGRFMAVATATVPAESAPPFPEARVAAAYLGTPWKAVKERIGSAFEPAAEYARTVLDQLSSTAKGWMLTPAYQAAHLGQVRAASEAPILDDSFLPTDQTAPVEVVEHPSVDENGVLRARFRVSGAAREGWWVHLTIRAGEETAISFSSKLEAAPGGEALEAKVEEPGVEVSPGYIPEESFRLSVAPHPLPE